jgi:ketosteroid isomerase-like protein
MTASHVTRVRELYAAFARGDIAAFLPHLSPDVEWKEPDHPFNPSSGTRHGTGGVLEWFRIGHEAEVVEVLTPERFLTDANGVAVFGHMRCRVRRTGKTYESDFVHLVTFRNDKIIRFQEFFDTYAAGEAFRT